MTTDDHGESPSKTCRAIAQTPGWIDPADDDAARARIDADARVRAENAAYHSMQPTAWHYPPSYPYPQYPSPRQLPRRGHDNVRVSLAFVAVGAALTLFGLATRDATAGLVLLVIGSMALLAAVLTNSHHPRG
jgi:hypothetical protein